jgi:hypothetical protein
MLVAHLRSCGGLSVLKFHLGKAEWAENFILEGNPTALDLLLAS